MEIETKAIITKEQFADLICKYADKLEFLPKQDTYYSKYDTYEERKENKEPTLRMRQEGEKFYFTIKQKEIKDGVESNEETETELSDPYAITKYFASNDLKSYFVKTKKSWGFKEVLLDESPRICLNNGSFTRSAFFEYQTIGHIEIECINDKVYAVELEVIYNPEEKENHGFNVDISALTTVRGLSKEDTIREAIMKWFEDNGLKDQIDNRSWMEILRDDN